MIPQIIHYCWYGSKELPSLYKECVMTWKEKCPNFTIVLWDETNTKLDTPFLQHHTKKKNWAFISDYMRMKALYLHGGIYLDADFELIRNLDPLRNYDCFLGLEAPMRPTSGIVGCRKGHSFPAACLEIMDKRHATKLPYLIAPEVTAKAISKSSQEVKILPEDYFYPYNPYDKTRGTSTLMHKDITHNTYAIHHWGKSWQQSLASRTVKRIIKNTSNLFTSKN